MLIKKDTVQFNVIPNIVTIDQDPWLGGTEPYWKLVDNGTWEKDTFEVLKKYLSLDHSYLDIGAWVGPTVLYGSQLAKTCYAFEPDPIAFNLLNRNLQANPQITNTKTFQQAVHSYTQELSFGSKTGQGDSMSSVLWSNGSWKVTGVSLEEIFNRENITDCNFIKIDIEGGEAETLSTAKAVLKKFKPTIHLSLHTPWITDKADFFAKLTDTLSIYKNIYDADGGAKIPLQDLSSYLNFRSIVVTDL